MPRPDNIGADMSDELVNKLRSFYANRRRDLPWRRDDGDPYRVWVSEVMLQQTRVETAVPYYEAWLERFPTLEALADAERDEVLKAWEGLGYYARARNLHESARLVREHHDSELPADPEALRELPGIGHYTAGAVASIAYGRAAPAVDANVRRVLSRLYDLEDPTAAELRRLAGELVPEQDPGEFNQAFMELGATVCTPRSPSCDACPVAELCVARAAGTQAERPRPKARKPIPEYDVGTAVVSDPDGRLLLARRPEDGLLGGMWEFPGAVAADGEAPAEAAVRAVSHVFGAAAAGVGARHALPLQRVTHTFSHRRHTYHPFRFSADSVPDPDPVPDTAAWVAPSGLSDYAMPVAQRTIAEDLLGGGP